MHVISTEILNSAGRGLSFWFWTHSSSLKFKKSIQKKVSLEEYCGLVINGGLLIFVLDYLLYYRLRNGLKYSKVLQLPEVSVIKLVISNKCRVKAYR